MTKYQRGRGYGARILLDSIGPSGKRITTFELRYPRMVHAELMTHRRFSRNSASSRAIPNEKLIAQVVEDPAMPVWWGKNQKGMQAREALSEVSVACRQCGVEPDRHSLRCSAGVPHDFRSDRDLAIDAWLKGRDEAVDLSRRLAALNLHKQIANRVIEPWMFITVLVTSTEYDNWFGQRDHADAQPEIAFVAEAMHVAYRDNVPRALREGEWHLPLVDRLDPERAGWTDLGSAVLLRDGFTPEELKWISAGRCARVSYLTHDGRTAPREDIDLSMRLSNADPGHWSPFEHVARALPDATPSGNFVGWGQFRKEFENEHIGGRCP